MSHFRLVASGIDTAPLLAELDANPDIWNHRPERRSGDSPHRETDDIWLRYATVEAMREPDFPRRAHSSVWWPAAKRLPSVYDYVIDLRRFGQLEAAALGGILITRIPPGKRVYEHHDDVAWHARHYADKIWLVLRGNDQCVNTVEDEAMVWKPGEAWTHSNLVRHSVTNGGDTERIVLIVCFRKER